jgi:RNA polymerase sigma-70 factor (ECF subfamily)
MIRHMPESQDKIEFELLARPHLDALYRTAFRMMHNASLAEDIVQECCLRAYRSLARYRRNTNFRAWIFRILVNLCIDHLRSHKHVASVPIESIDDDSNLISGEPGPERRAISSNMRGSIRNAIAALEPDLRVVAILVLVEEMSYGEAAETLAIPVGTVRSRLHRARAQLQVLLGGDLSAGPPAEPRSADEGAIAP